MLGLEIVWLQQKVAEEVKKKKQDLRPEVEQLKRRINEMSSLLSVYEQKCVENGISLFSGVEKPNWCEQMLYIAQFLNIKIIECLL